MPKKKRIALVLLIGIWILINLFVILYQKPISSKTITFRIETETQENVNIKLYYLLDHQKMPDEFSEEQSVEGTVSEDKEYSFTIPANVSYVRIDLDQRPVEVRILAMQCEYRRNQCEIGEDMLSDIKLTQQMEYIAEENKGILFCGQGEDAYFVLSTENWGLLQLTGAPTVSDIVLKIVICILLELLLYLMIRCFDSILLVPKDLIRNCKLLFSLAKNDFKTKFAGSYLGIIWAFVQPIVTVLVYWFVFQKGLKANGMNTGSVKDIPFVLWLLAGLVPWFFFQEALSGGTNSLLDYSYLVKKVVFKISILPTVKVISALFVHAFFVVFTVILYACYRFYPDLYTLQIVYYSLAAMIFVMGLVYATSAIVIFFRDLSQIINIILQVGMWMTPIMWNIDTIDLHPVLINLFKLNPLYYIVAGYRDSLINKVWFWERTGTSLYFWVVTAACFSIGTIIFNRLKVHFADVL